MNGFLVFDGGTVELPAPNEAGLSGGGRVTPLEKPILFDELSCSSVGAFVVLANGFGAREAVVPNGFVAR
jgi:hypothetical protein